MPNSSVPKRKGCRIEECNNLPFARGLCAKHYSRWRRHGDPLITSSAPAGLSLKDKITRYSNVDHSSNCWLWVRHKNDGGYGTIHCHEGHWLAHRAAYAAYIGEIPDGLCVLHRCDTPACVNPAHLFLGTQLDNMKDRNEKRRQACGEALPGGKLTASDVRDIKRLLSDQPRRGLQAEISRKYRVAPQSVSCIHTGKTWKHV